MHIRTTPEPGRPLHYIIALLLLITTFESCEPSKEPVNLTEAAQEALDQIKGQYRIELVEQPQVCLKEFTCVWDGFKDHFQSRTAIPEIDRSPVNLEWSEVVREVGTPLNPDAVGVKFHYGAEVIAAKTHIKLAMEVVGLMEKQRPIFYEISSPATHVFPIKADGKLGSPMLKSDWRNGPQVEYFRQIKIKRTNDGSFIDPIRDVDHEAYLFKWVDLEALINNNTGADRIHLYSIGSPLIRTTTIEDDWFHDLAGVAANNAIEYMRDDPLNTAKPYMNRAADLGSPCPPSCILARFYRYGLAPKSICKCP